MEQRGKRTTLESNVFARFLIVVVIKKLQDAFRFITESHC